MITYIYLCCIAIKIFFFFVFKINFFLSILSELLIHLFSSTPLNSLLSGNTFFFYIDSFSFGSSFAAVGSLKKSKEGNYLITRVYKSTLVTVASQSSGDPGTSQPTLLHWSIFTVGLDTILYPWCVTKAYEGRETGKSEKEGKGKT